MKFTEEDFKSYQVLSFHLEKNVDWKVSTTGILEVNSCIAWFNKIGQAIKNDVLAAKEEPVASEPAADDPKSKEVLQKLKSAK